MTTIMHVPPDTGTNWVSNVMIYSASPPGMYRLLSLAVRYSSWSQHCIHCIIAANWWVKKNCIIVIFTHHLHTLFQFFDLFPSPPTRSQIGIQLFGSSGPLSDFSMDLLVMSHNQPGKRATKTQPMLAPPGWPNFSLRYWILVGSNSCHLSPFSPSI